MKNFKLGLFSYMVKEVGMKCMSDALTNAPSGDPVAKNDLAQAKELLEDIKKNIFDFREYAKLDAVLEKVKNENIAQKKALFYLLEEATAEESDFSGLDKIQLTKLKNKWEASYAEAKEVKAVATEKVVTDTKEKTLPLKRELLENTPIVQDYAPHINLGSAINLIKAQIGTPEQKLATAKLEVKNSGIAFGAENIQQNDQKIPNYTFSRSQNTLSEKGRNAKRAIEADKLLKFIDTLAKDPVMQERLLASNIPADRPVNPNSVLDLMMDFDDDGMLEAINSTDKSGLWKRLTSALGFGTAMQSEFTGELQSRKNMDDAKLKTVLAKYKITIKDGELLKDFAKRARSILLLRADMLQSTDMSETGDKNMYQNSKNNRESLDNTVKLVDALRKSIKEKVSTANISEKDVNVIANQMSANILKWVTTIGMGAINMDTLLTKMGRAVAVGQAPGIQDVLVLDETVVVNILKGETLKLNASAGAGVGGGTGEIVPFAHIGLGGQLTALNNADLKKLSDMKGNFTIGVGVNAGLSFANGLSLSPVPSLDIKWDDKIDTLENAGIRLGSYLDAATQFDATGKVIINLEAVPKDIDPSLMDALNMLKDVIENGGGTLIGDQQMAHAILMKQRFLAAFKLSLAAEGKLGGFSLAGVKFIFLPGALGFGPTFQNVGNERKAAVVERVKTKLTSVEEQKVLLASYGLELTGTTLKQIAGFDASKITLAEGLAWNANNSIVLTGNNVFDIVGGGSISDSLGATEESNNLMIGTKVGELVGGSSKEIKNAELAKLDNTNISPESLGIRDTLVSQINELNIDVLIRQSESFMRIMTKKPINFNTAAKAIEKIPMLGSIAAQAKSDKKLNEVMLYIDSLLVGDDITRGFNKAKTDKKFFEQYKKILIAKAPQNLRPELRKMTQESLKISDIDFAFNSTHLRTQELALMNKKLNLSAADQTALRVADQKLIKEMGNEEELKTVGHGYLLMARNRRGAGLQGVRDIPNGGYLKKEELTSLTPAKKMEIVNQMEGLNKLIQKNILAKFRADSVMTEQLKKIDPSKFTPDNKGEISIPLLDGKTLRMNLSQSKISSALYGEVTKGKQNAVCLNVATLIEPVLSGAIFGTKNEVIPGTVMNEFSMDTDIVANPSEVKMSEFSLIGVIPTKKPETPATPPAPTTTPGTGTPTPPAPTTTPGTGTPPAPLAPVVIPINNSTIVSPVAPKTTETSTAPSTPANINTTNTTVDGDL